MEPRKLSVAFCGFPYSGNGGGQSEHPAIRNWLIPLMLELKQDKRISGCMMFDKADTPITMNRNAAVLEAKSRGADVLCMFDSDMKPDILLGIDPNAKPFFQSGFDLIYQRWESRKTVVAAPYCAAPPVENVMALEWVNFVTGEIATGMKLELISRSDAVRRTGFENIGALATGLILYDLRIFDELPPPWFYYEYEGDGAACPHCHQRKPGVQAQKCSTEDVVNTRDISLFYFERYRYNPIFVNWDAWAGHWKSKLVQKPHQMTVDSVGSSLRQAVLGNHTARERVIVVGEDSAATGMGTKTVFEQALAPQTNGNGHKDETATVSSVRQIYEDFDPAAPRPVDTVPPDSECIAVQRDGGEVHRLVSTEVLRMSEVGQRDCDQE